MAAVLASGLTLTSCGEDFLESLPTDHLADGGTATESSINSGLAATYQILLFDSYANNNYEAIPVIADVQSDDCYKGGGGAGDQLQIYNISLFQADGLHTLPGSWNIYTSGFARANAVINACKGIENPSATVKQYNAEAHFLRAYYVYMLWKYFGNIVFFTEPLTPATNYMTPQITADEAYAQIIADVEVAAEEGVLAMSTNGTAEKGPDKGRVSRAAALMLKARAVMYQNDKSRYQEVANDLATIIKSGAFELEPDFDALWDNDHEFCNESIFESNQMGEGKTWSSGWAAMEQTSRHSSLQTVWKILLAFILMAGASVLYASLHTRCSLRATPVAMPLSTTGEKQSMVLVSRTQASSSRSMQHVRTTGSPQETLT